MNGIILCFEKTKFEDMQIATVCEESYASKDFYKIIYHSKHFNCYLSHIPMCDPLKVSCTLSLWLLSKVRATRMPILSMILNSRSLADVGCEPYGKRMKLLDKFALVTNLYYCFKRIIMFFVKQGV